MLSAHKEKSVLQFVIALACVVPLSAGLGGIVGGVKLLDGDNINLDSHFRYVSGLLLALGLGFLSSIPNIEHNSSKVRLLTAIVIIGGSGRLIGIFLAGVPNNYMIVALGMELLVTPLICLWQHRLAKRFNKKDVL